MQHVRRGIFEEWEINTTNARETKLKFHKMMTVRNFCMETKRQFKEQKYW
jgi:hypothetical protein